jgi:hypothetical protein
VIEKFIEDKKLSGKNKRGKKRKESNFASTAPKAKNMKRLKD